MAHGQHTRLPHHIYPDLCCFGYKSLFESCISPPCALYCRLNFNPIFNIAFGIPYRQVARSDDMARFTPKQYKKEQFTIRMEQELLENVDMLAAEYNLSRSEFIVQCVRFAIGHMEQDDAQKE